MNKDEQSQKKRGRWKDETRGGEIGEEEKVLI